MEFCKNLQYNKEMNRQPVLDLVRLNEEVGKLKIKPGKLAEELTISYETLYKTLKGEISQPPAETIAKLAVRTGCSIEYFMGLTDKRESMAFDMDDLEQEIIRATKTLPVWRQRDLLIMAKAYQDADDPTAEMVLALLDEVEEFAGTALRAELSAALDARRAARASSRQRRPPAQEGEQEAQSE